MNSNIVLRIFSGLVIAGLFIFSIWKIVLFKFVISLVALGMLFEWYNLNKNHLGHLLIGLIVICIAIASLIVISVEHNSNWLFAYFILIWSVDVFAMIGGKIIDGPRLAPKLSPNKTWSGLVVGVTVASANVIFFNELLDAPLTDHYNINTATLWVFAIALAIIAQVSDLFVSYFKRYHKVKDSGSIIPGHGGVLDRFDSILLTAPVLLFLLQY